MKKSDRIKRAIAFYLSVVSFFILLPIVLSYSLGYKIDYRPFRIYKTGILYINSYPQGASIYINGKRNAMATPAQIEELKPGSYKVDVKREGYYPWDREVVVRPNMVTRLDRIVLFPIAQDIQRVSKWEIKDFVISDTGNIVYYFTQYGLLRSDISGGGLKRLSSYKDWPKNIKGKLFSPDGSKILFFTENDVWVVYLNPDKRLPKNTEEAIVEEIFTSHEPIESIFWYSTSGYIIVVTEKSIKVVELRSGDKCTAVLLHKFNSRSGGVYYNGDSDSIYFVDTRKESSRDESYLYRMDLRQKFLDQFVQFILLKKDTEAIGE